MARAATERESGEWILSWALAGTRWTRGVAGPGNPVYLHGVTGHTPAANSRALELLAPPEDTPGVMRDAAGQPNGLLADEANSLALSKLGDTFGADEKASEMIALAVDKALPVRLNTIHALEGGSVGEDRALRLAITLATIVTRRRVHRSIGGPANREPSPAGETAENSSVV